MPHMPDWFGSLSICIAYFLFLGIEEENVSSILICFSIVVQSLTMLICTSSVLRQNTIWKLSYLFNAIRMALR